MKRLLILLMVLYPALAVADVDLAQIEAATDQQAAIDALVQAVNARVAAANQSQVTDTVISDEKNKTNNTIKEQTNVENALDQTTPQNNTRGQSTVVTIGTQEEVTGFSNTGVFTPRNDAADARRAAEQRKETERIAALEQNAENMRQKENSAGNRILGAAASYTAGTGAQQMAENAARQNAQENAENAMKTYLSTFRCTYGTGNQTPFGTMSVELPGRDEMVNMLADYVSLANEIKEMKANLNMPAGFEAEVILKPEETGLYDDVGSGIASRAYTSLAAALTDPYGTDAQAWEAAKKEAADGEKKGRNLLAAGVLGGIVGNALINARAPKESSRQINDKYDLALYNLETSINNTPTSNVKRSCPSFYIDMRQSGAEAPDCVCIEGYVYDPDSNGCIECAAPKRRVQIPGTIYYQCLNPDSPPQDSNAVVMERTVDASGKTSSLNARNLFGLNGVDLSKEGKEALDKFAKDLAEIKRENPDKTYCIDIDGHTDPTGDDEYNQCLSLLRAQTVQNYLFDKGITGTTTHGWGQYQCTSRGEDKNCRRVTVNISEGKCVPDLHRSRNAIQGTAIGTWAVQVSSNEDKSLADKNVKTLQVAYRDRVGIEQGTNANGDPTYRVLVYTNSEESTKGIISNIKDRFQNFTNPIPLSGRCLVIPPETTPAQTSH
ncbi:OmpA family protein [bacterium]|nr:OmpA family protein [bacterium]